MSITLLLGRNARHCAYRQHVLRVQARGMSISPGPSPSASSSNSSSRPRPYQFHIGASWSGKPPDVHPLLSKKKNKEQGFPSDSPIGRWRTEELNRWPAGRAGRVAGEDFLSVCGMRDESGVSLAVADGVGGWADSGVDPAVFSQAMMYHVQQTARRAWAGEPESDPASGNDRVEGKEMGPGDVMSVGYEQVLRDPGVVAGSSTACIVHLNASNGILRASNLGDSGFCIIRSSTIIHDQPSQTHYFNCPRQISKLPRGYRGSISDTPRDADSYETRLRDGDIVVLFTDGCSDNVFPEEIAQISSLISRNISGEAQQAQALADKIVDYAHMCMWSKTKTSPFEVAARRVGEKYKGGKVDDVTVVVAVVREAIDAFGV